MKNLDFIKRNKCPICNSFNSNEVAALKKDVIINYLNNYYGRGDFENLLINYHYHLIKCKSCNFIYQLYVLDDESTKNFYENIEKHNTNQKNKKNSYEKKNYKFVNFLKSKFFDNKRIDVLDFGSGYTKYPKKNESISFFTYDIATEGNDENFTSFQDLKDKKFDIILLNQVLEHVTDPSLIIRELQTYLKSNGILKIEFPSSNLINYKLFLMKIFGLKKNIIHEFFPIEHINCFSEKSINILFQNFSEIKINLKLFSLDQNGSFLFKILKYFMIKNKFIKSIFTFLTLKNGGNYFLLKIK